MKFRYLPLAVMAFFALSCQTNQTAEAASKSGDAPAISELYGDYLAASYANEISDKAGRQKYYTESFEQASDDVRIGRRAIVSAIENNDFAAAVKLSERVYKLDKTEAMARGVLGVHAFERGRTKRALKYFAGPSDDFTLSLLMNLVRGWVEVDRGEIEMARKRFTAVDGADYFGAVGQLQLANLELREGNYAAAEAALDEVEPTGISPIEIVLTRARLLATQGKTEDAIAALEARVADNQAFAIGPVGDYIERLKAGKPLPEIDIKGQAARALTDPAFGFFARAGSQDGAELFLRFAHYIDPTYGKSTVWLASILEEGDKAAQIAAREFYLAVDQDNPYYVSAQLSLANIYFVWEDDDNAIEVLEALNARENTLLTRESLGRARFFRENYAEALPFYDDIVNSMSEEELSENVEPLRFRAIIQERLDMWPQAEADFKRVLEFAPDDVDTLNYLGYTWVDRGENLTEAFDMIRRALQEEPESGAITDSLGWAHYKLGDYELAKDKLEDAVVLSPSSATIIDHLGDVYWKLGRKREAGFQWKRALEFEPTEEERAAIMIKLEGGLEALPDAQ